MVDSGCLIVCEQGKITTTHTSTARCRLGGSVAGGVGSVAAGLPVMLVLSAMLVSGSPPLLITTSGAAAMVLMAGVVITHGVFDDGLLDGLSIPKCACFVINSCVFVYPIDIPPNMSVVPATTVGTE